MRKVLQIVQLLALRHAFAIPIVNEIADQHADLGMRELDYVHRNIPQHHHYQDPLVDLDTIADWIQELLPRKVVTSLPEKKMIAKGMSRGTEKRSRNNVLASQWPILRRKIRTNDHEYKLMSENKASPDNRRLRSDPMLSISGQMMDQHHEANKRNQYMLLRKGRDTSSEEGDLELIGIADLSKDPKSTDTVKEQERMSTLRKRSAGEPEEKRHRDTYLMRMF